MSRVYRAIDSTLQREVAVKVLLPHLAPKADARRRFDREARAVARLRHPNILEIFDYAAGDDTELPFIVTEFIRGETLRVFAERVRFLPTELAAMCGLFIAKALAHAHAAGVVHRDLKPENVMVRADGTLKLMDFGIATLIDRDERMTATGSLLGSPAHMAPEIIEGKEADTRSDLFSLGTLLYWLATGKLPFEGSNAGALLKRILDGDYRPAQLSEPAISDGLAAVIDGLLMRDPARRVQSADAVVAQLSALIDDAGIEDPSTALAAFFVDPATQAVTLRSRLVSRFTERGERELKAGRTATALAAFGRVLALDPQNAPVRARLSQVRKRARLRRRLLETLAVVAIGGLGFSLFQHWPWAPEVIVATPVLSAAVHLAENPSPTPPPALTSTPAKPDPDTPPQVVHAVSRAPASHATPSPAVLVPFELKPRTYAHFWLDERDLGDSLPKYVGQAKAGPHHLRAEHPCCAPLVKTIELEVGKPNHFPIELVPLPASVIITSAPGAQVLLDGKPAGTAEASQRTPIQVPMIVDGRPVMERQIVLRVEKDGHRSEESTQRLHAHTRYDFELPIRAE